MHSLIEDNGLRVNDIFSEVDIPVMHGYPMYADWATGPLDPDFVPYLCALTTALCGKPTLMEEFGGSINVFCGKAARNVVLIISLSNLRIGFFGIT